jgi:hypothetical protein
MPAAFIASSKPCVRGLSVWSKSCVSNATFALPFIFVLM